MQINVIATSAQRSFERKPQSWFTPNPINIEGSFYMLASCVLGIVGFSFGVIGFDDAQWTELSYDTCNGIKNLVLCICVFSCFSLVGIFYKFILPWRVGITEKDSDGFVCSLSFGLNLSIIIWTIVVMNSSCWSDLGSDVTKLVVLMFSGMCVEVVYVLIATIYLIIINQ